jgi:hypothetical protein
VAFPSKGPDLEAKGISVLGGLFRRQYPLLSLGARSECWRHDDREKASQTSGPGSRRPDR